MRHVLAFASLTVLAACVAPSARPPAPPRPVPVPAPAPAPAPPPPTSSDWRDWPVTPGNWRYQQAGEGGVASYGAAGGMAIFSIRCAGDRLVFERTGASGPLTIRTSSTARTLTAPSVPAGDPLIDAMGFSRGRFIVETPGAPPLVLPAWSEVLRVAEDCRG